MFDNLQEQKIYIFTDNYLDNQRPFGFIIYYDVTLKSIGKLKIITDVW